MIFYEKIFSAAGKIAGLSRTVVVYCRLQDKAIRCRERSFMIKQQHYKAALYCRLSVDDGNFGGSVSIETQKVLLEQYCNSQRYSLEDKIIKEYPRQISVLEKRIEAYGKDLEHMRTVKDPDEGISMMVIAGKPYTDRETAGEALASALKVVKSTTDKYNIGSFKGFDMYLSYNSFSRQFTLDLKREGTHSVVLGDSNAGNITRIENALNSIEKRIEGSKEQLKTVREQREEAKAELAKPFSREKELADKLTRLAQLNAELNIDGAGKSEISADEKPSVLGEISNLKKQAKEKDKGIGKKPERDDTDKKDGRQAI